MNRITKIGLSSFAATSLGIPAMAQALEREYKFDIESHSIGATFPELSKQTGLKIGYGLQQASRGLVDVPIGAPYAPEAAARPLLTFDSLSHQNGNQFVATVAERERDDSTGGQRATSLAQLASLAGGAIHDSGEKQNTRIAAGTEPASVRSARGTLEEIIVTAQKREEKLQEVPVAVTVVNSTALASTSQLRLADYYASVPGLDMHPGPAQGWQINIRGISSGTGVENPSVGVVIDDIPYSMSLRYGGATIPEIDPGGLAHMEVLRGPQGTFYGASAMAGLLKLVTPTPSTEDLKGRLQVGSNMIKGGDDVGYSIRGSINVPVSDTFAFRASGFDYVQPGFIDNVATGHDDVNETKGRGGHLAAFWQATDAVSLKFSALLQKIEPQGSWLINESLGDLKVRDTVTSGMYERTAQAYGLTLTAALGAAEVTSLSGYNRFAYEGRVGLAPNLIVTDDTDTEKWSEELRIRMPLGERVEWLMGVFFTKEQFTFTQGLPFIDPISGARTGVTLLDALTDRGDHEELAAFTNLTFKLNDRFDVQLGGRQAHYEGDMREVWIGPLAPAGIIPAAFGSPFYTPHVEYKDDAFTYLLAPRYRISPNWMVYARVASGYRTGGPNSQLGQDELPVIYPDETQNYEFGVKGSFLDQRVRVDFSVYHVDWQNIQLLTRALLANGIGKDVYVNGPDARSQGLEAVFDIYPWDGMKMGLWGTWTDAELTGAAPPQLIGFFGRPGEQLPDTARFTGYFSLEQEFVLDSDRSWYLGGNVSYRGKRMSAFVAPALGLSRTEFPSYVELDLSAGAHFASWEIGIYANNVLDKRAGVGFNAVTGQGRPNQPRTIGITLSKSFE